MAAPFPLSDRASDVRPGCKTQRIAPTLRQVADLMCARIKEREYFKTCIVGHVNCCLQCGPTLIKTYVWSALLYGSECCTLNKEIEGAKKLEAVKMWFIRRMMRISWTEKKSKEVILKEANLERSLIKTIRQRQLQFLGHVCQHKSLEHLAVTGKIEGKRSRGRQRITFIENLNCRTTSLPAITWFPGSGPVRRYCIFLPKY
ncbi:endonuclease-reverse transcriptase [Plakobranchus ocellatus]|uniref:Endonuclease-reverse transcriptase n=1 Tax=Plakobranchus ocellatus TaxID=259542 RepID=A0AAV4CVV0_9GAST|nr:endonuclease-reverse transcriptase [Plakobranchus ocellatus]